MKAEDFLQVKRQIWDLWNSPQWAFLTEQDDRDLRRVACTIFMHPERGRVIGIAWNLYLRAAQLKIAMRARESETWH